MVNELTESIGAAIARGSERLRSIAGAGAAMEARSLLLDACGLDTYTALLARADERLTAAQLQQFENYVQARLRGQPVAYILGWREFYRHRFHTTAAALIPRPETELLVETALAHLPRAAVAAKTVLELGTGSGAIGISIALARPQAYVVMTDVTPETLELAARNARRHQAQNIRLCLSDWYEKLPLPDGARVDLIVTNPPYIADDDEHLQQGDLRFEPPIALRGGCDGLSALQRIIGEAPQHLRRGGVLMVENGYDQAAAVFDLFVRAGFCGVSQLRDLNDTLRVTLGVLS